MKSHYADTKGFADLPLGLSTTFQILGLPEFCSNFLRAMPLHAC